MNEIERGLPIDGINPKLIERLPGGALTGLASGRPLTEVLENKLRRLDGDGRGVLIIFTRSDDDYFPDMNTSDLVEYIQSAGSATGMTIEVRRREGDGFLHHYALGRRDDEPGERTITWASDDPEDPHSLTVPAAEVFTASQAHPVYLQWCWDQTVPEGYRLRELDIVKEG